MVVTAAHNWESGDWNLQTVTATCAVYLRRPTALISSKTPENRRRSFVSPYCASPLMTCSEAVWETVGIGAPTLRLGHLMGCEVLFRERAW